MASWNLPGPGALGAGSEWLAGSSGGRASWDTGTAPGAYRGTGGGAAYISPTMNYGAYSAPGQNLENIGYITALASAMNRINLGAQKEANLSRIPGEAGLEAKSSANIAQELAGKVPGDVIALLGQQAAERGVGTGSNVNASYLRALGLTSVGQQKSGQQDLTAATARNPAAPLYDPSGQLITPGQVTQAELEQQRLQLERDRLAAEVAGGYYNRGGGGGRAVIPGPRDTIEALASPGTYAAAALGPFSVPNPAGGVTGGYYYNYPSGDGSRVYMGSLEGGPAETPTRGVYMGSAEGAPGSYLPYFYGSTPEELAGGVGG